MKDGLASTMMATDLADYLVRKGATFREAHASVGQLVRAAESQGVELHTLPLKTFAAAHPLFESDVFDALSPVGSVERREVDGGTGPGALQAQLQAARASLRRDAGAKGNDVEDWVR